MEYTALFDQLLLQTSSGDSKVVYFGDNLHTDVLASKLHSLWVPVAIGSVLFVPLNFETA